MVFISLLAFITAHTHLVTGSPVPAPALSQATSTDESEQSIVGFWFIAGMLATLSVVSTLRIIYLCFIVIRSSFRSIRLTNDIPGEFDYEQQILEEDNRALTELQPQDQELYFQVKDFFAVNPIDNSSLDPSQLLAIEERGISAFEFKANAAVAHDIQVLNKTEITFQFPNPHSELSIQTNYPIPRTADVYYFESKIMSLPEPENTLVSVGISTSPYPYFRLPGRHRQSLSYDSNGDRRFNQLFQLKAGAGLSAFPKVIYGDVVGIGYRTRSGTIFFTRNGKKVSESKIGGHVSGFKFPKLYPTIGATNNCSVHVNIGQTGFVFIEANVKKWGFAALEGNGPPPPAYKTFNEDVLLESSSEYSDGEESFPPNFWTATAAQLSDARSDDENITLNTLPQDPPLYRTDSDAGSETGDTNNQDVPRNHNNNNIDNNITIDESGVGSQQQQQLRVGSMVSIQNETNEDNDNGEDADEEDN